MVREPQRLCVFLGWPIPSSPPLHFPAWHVDRQAPLRAKAQQQQLRQKPAASNPHLHSHRSAVLQSSPMHLGQTGSGHRLVVKVQEKLVSSDAEILQEEFVHL